MRCSPLTARLASLVAGLSLVAAVGCSPSNAKLSGKVTYQGTALKGGTVTFIPEGGGETFSTTIDENGTYEFQQIRPGRYKVCVETVSVKSGGTSTGPAYAGKGPGGPAIDKSKIKNTPPPDAKVPEGYRPSNPFVSSSAAAQRFVPIPPEYGKPETTRLTAEVKGGVQQHDIPLD